MYSRRHEFIILFLGCALWVGFPSAAILKALTGGRSGASGGPPNYIVPSVMLGFFFGVLLAGLITYTVRKVSDAEYWTIALGVFISGIVLTAALLSLFR